MWERGQPVPRTILLPCGAKASFDKQSGISMKYVFLYSLIFLSACSSDPKETESVEQIAEIYIEDRFTRKRQCSDGTLIYELSDGTYAVYVENPTPTWVPLSPGVTPENYC